MNQPLVLHRVANHLDHNIVSHVDGRDLAIAGNERANALRSRALAAFCISSLTGADPEETCGSIVDGYGDEGIDAVFFQKDSKCLYIVQSKWKQNGTGSVGVGECLKFFDGVQRLIGTNYSAFNKKIQARQEEIVSVISRSDVNIILVLACSSSSDLSEEVQAKINEFLEFQNGAADVDIFKFEWFNLGRIYSSISSQSDIKHIKLTIGLSEWGTMQKPYRAYYGQMKLSDIANLAKYDRFLFHKNIRYYQGTTEVNGAMESTLLRKPEHFWYLNNGVTILCRRLSKTPLNGRENNWGTFECQDVSVVNGAQTVGVIWDVFKKNPSLFAGSAASVNVRLISLENVPDGFDFDITTATNTQNKIEFRDFAALDSLQHRLANEMKMDNRHYAFKSGDSFPKDSDGCSLEDATVALACSSSDVSLAVLAKREIGGFYRNLKAPPYTTIFNEDLSARDLWRAVVVLRAVNKELGQVKSDNQQLAVHGNRFILHQVFQDPAIRDFRNPVRSDEELDTLATGCTPAILARVAAAVERKYSGAYLQPLFKNIERCKTLLNGDDRVQNPDLFGWNRSNGH